MKIEKLSNDLGYSLNEAEVCSVLIHASVIDIPKEQRWLLQSYNEQGKLMLTASCAVDFLLNTDNVKKITGVETSTYSNLVLTAMYLKYEIKTSIQTSISEASKDHPEVVSQLIGYLSTKLDFYRLHEFVFKIYQETKSIPIQYDNYDYKTLLQEYCYQKYKSVPVYSLINSTGPSHETNYTFQVIVGKSFGTGQGTSKKAAQQNAAKDYIEKNKVPKRDFVHKTTKPVNNESQLISVSREHELLSCMKLLGISSLDIDLAELNRDLTHPSFSHESHTPIDDYSLIKQFGSFILQYICNDYSREYVHDYSVSCKNTASAYSNLETLRKVVNLELWKYVLKGKGERGDNQIAISTIVTDCYKAIIGGLYLNSIKKLTNHSEIVAKKLVYSLLDSISDNAIISKVDRLQQLVQKYNGEIIIETLSAESVSVQSSVETTVTVKITAKLHGEFIEAIGIGRNSSIAKNQAAEKILEEIF